MRSRSLVLVACVLGLAVVPARAWADPVAITSGFFAVTGTHASADFDFEGDGFRASGSLEPGVTWPDLTCFPCAAGEVIRLDTEFLASNGNGTATVDGQSFPQVSLAALGFDFSAPTVVAPDTVGDFTVTRPFTFSGRLLGVDGIEQQVVFFDRFLVGQGLLTASFAATPSPDGPLFSFRSIRYDFSEPEPVPEPATLVLFGTGLVAALRCRRRRSPANGGEDAT